MSRLRLLPVLAVLLALAALALALISYPVTAPLVLVGAAVVFAILTLKE